MKNLINFKKSTPLFSSRIMANPFLKEIDRAINEFYSILGKSSFYPSSSETFTLNPSIDIIEDEQNFKVEVEMPGMSEEDIKVHVHNNILTIQGKKETSKRDEGKNYISREIEYGSYERNIVLPDYVETDKANASFKKGMLWVNFPKKAGTEAQRREIKIEKIPTE